MSILPIKPKIFDSSFRKLWLPKLTFVSSYVFLMLVASLQYLKTVEEFSRGVVGFSVNSLRDKFGLLGAFGYTFELRPTRVELRGGSSGGGWSGHGAVVAREEEPANTFGPTS